MANVVLVDESIKGTKVITERGAQYGDSVHAVQVMPGELPTLCGFYPVMISGDKEGQMALIAVLGLEPGENLYLNGNQWDAGYLPLTLRQQPFTITRENTLGDDGKITKVPSLAIDMDSPRISKEEGHDIVDENGEPTAYFREINGIIQTIAKELPVTGALLNKLRELDLIQPLASELRLADGKTRRLQGLNTINEIKLRELPEEEILKLHANGFLDCIYSIRASLGHMGGLAQRKNARLRAAGLAQD
jgi:SapC